MNGWSENVRFPWLRCLLWDVIWWAWKERSALVEPMRQLECDISLEVAWYKISHPTHIQKQINRLIDLARCGIMLQYWSQPYTFCGVSQLCFPRCRNWESLLYFKYFFFACPNSGSVRACPVSRKYAGTIESCPKRFYLPYIYTNRSHKAIKIRCFLCFSYGRTWKTINNDAVNVAVDFSLPSKVAQATLHMHIHSFRTFTVVSCFQVVFDTSVVLWVVTKSLEEKHGGIWEKPATGLLNTPGLNPLSYSWFFWAAELWLV